MNMKQMFLLAALTIGAGGSAEAQSNTTTAGVPMLTLNNGVQMPQFGLGVYSLKEGDETLSEVWDVLSRTAVFHVTPFGLRASYGPMNTVQE
jgi:hypothetical protein